MLDQYPSIEKSTADKIIDVIGADLDHEPHTAAFDFVTMLDTGSVRIRDLGVDFQVPSDINLEDTSEAILKDLGV